MAGGCGCKISPKGLQDILKNVPPSSIPIPKELLVGIETSDDACVYQLNAEQARHRPGGNPGAKR